MQTLFPRNPCRKLQRLPLLRILPRQQLSPQHPRESSYRISARSVPKETTDPKAQEETAQHVPQTEGREALLREDPCRADSVPHRAVRDLHREVQDPDRAADRGSRSQDPAQHLHSPAQRVVSTAEETTNTRTRTMTIKTARRSSPTRDDFRKRTAVTRTEYSLPRTMKKHLQ